MRPAGFDPEVIVQSLQGTCSSIQDALGYHYPEMDESELTEDDHNHIDNEIFLCAECGWWCEQSQSTDKDGENVCDECNPDDDED